MKGLFSLLRTLQHQQNQLSDHHDYLLQLLQSIQLDSSPSFPSKVIIPISSFQQIAQLASSFGQQDLHIKQITDLLFQQLQPLQKIQRMSRNLKLSLFHIKERLRRDGKFINQMSVKVQSVIHTFRQRCKDQFKDFLVNLDSDLRTILLPLVPQDIIKENVKYGPLKPVNFSQSLYEQQMEAPTGLESSADRLNSHINMMVGTLETVAKDLLELLDGCNRKFQECFNPNYSVLPTPVAAPLPQYFVFGGVDSVSEPETGNYYINRVNMQKVKNKLDKLEYIGDFTEGQVRSIKKKLKELFSRDESYDFNSLLKDIEIPVTKKEEIVFKLCNSGLLEEHLERKEVENLNREREVTEFPNTDQALEEY